MTLTKKYFIDAADDVARNPCLYERIVLAKMLALFFARHNYQFDVSKFFRACNVPYGNDFDLIVPEYDDE